MSDAPTRKVEIFRKDSAVVLVINCVDNYAAMILYEEIARELVDGYLTIDIETGVKRSAIESEP